jgi:hypothetical protein
MTSNFKGLIAVVAISMPGVALAQSSDGDYCRALVAKYEQYLDMSSKRGRQPQSLEAREAVARCKIGDQSGIPGIEKALQDAKFSLPSRAMANPASAIKEANCGPETWSTEKMMYVGVPCPTSTTQEISTTTSR